MCDAKKSVSFSDFHVFYPVPHEDRKGLWHLYAIDRDRFKRRCLATQKVLDPMLAEKHQRALRQIVSTSAKPSE